MGVGVLFLGSKNFIYQRLDLLNFVLAVRGDKIFPFLILLLSIFFRSTFCFYFLQIKKREFFSLFFVNKSD
jgi:hypothetical protein